MVVDLSNTVILDGTLTYSDKEVIDWKSLKKLVEKDLIKCLANNNE